MKKSGTLTVKLFLFIFLIISLITCSKDDNSTQADPCAFSMSTAIVHCIVLFPENGASLTSGSVTLKWVATTHYPTYELYFGTDKENLPLISTQTTGSYTISNLEAGKTYYWSVTASDYCKRGCVTGIINFSVVTA